MEEPNIRSKIVEKLRCGPSTGVEIANALGVSEGKMLFMLDQLRFDRVVEFAGGEWSLTVTFKANASG